ncbi:formimidoylglutamate deiminase [Curtobacterium sp. ISL-83]|uniref:formimidoylglutamate deiminase n=1 Tax=Curtobacterium sp. ISL-83 TaxID=2819145 RepID=UPI001BEC065D|nr:formimidoylglutamate deiminase [Curtobacterium sp. ISL-83]MBT2501106.1 formimidoylglutamate deiminase [Curtobacterium sp. ISL-83]
MTGTRLHVETLLDPADSPAAAVVEVEDGRVARIVREGDAAFERRPGDVEFGTVLPGFVNAHSHAFHRVLRGRTHADGGDFWQWRQRMYEAAGALDPDLYHRLATGVFREMLAAGWTTVGEFHYVHHQPDGSPYLPAHGMEAALASAAQDAGIRLVLLDTLYLTGGVDQPLAPEQRRFGDGDASWWLDRWHALRERLADSSPLVTLGAAVHSTRAVPPPALATVAAGLPAHTPLHVHLSEQPQENADVLTRYGVTPTRLLSDAGLLTPRLTVVHATHLTDDDVAALGAARVSVVMCPTTEADLADGIGPARALADAGARIAVGSDQNAVVDPFLEMRGLEAAERLGSGRRGRFAPRELLAAASAGGAAALGLVEGRPDQEARGLAVGDLADFVEVDDASVRTTGSSGVQLVLTATASDVRRVVVGGEVLGRGDDAASGLREAIAEVDRRTAGGSA